MVKVVAVSIFAIGCFVSSLADFHSCQVPYVRYGRLGRYERANSSSVSDGEFISLVESTEVKHNDIVTLRCHAGFKTSISVKNMSIGNIFEEEITCQDGIWSQPLICLTTNCLGEPPGIENGYTVIFSRTHGSVIWYMCKIGYVTMKYGKIVCDYGTWKGEATVCGNNHCDTNKLNYTGLIKPEQLLFNHTESFNISCEYGFKKSIMKEKITCYNGKWNIKQNPCNKEVRCEIPTVPDRGSVRVSADPKVGSLALFSCQVGTTLIGTSTSNCLISGEWTFPPPKCFTSCYVPAIKDGEMGQFSTRYTWYRFQEEFLKLPEGERVQHNHSVYLSCKDDFMPVDYSATSKNSRLEQVTCSDGIWSKRLECKSSRCDTHKLNYTGLSKPELQLFNHTESFNISCEYGFKKSITKEKITCYNGKWDIKQNPCTIDTRCEIPNAPDRGSVRVSDDLKVGSLALYSCQEGTTLIGTSTSNCLISGEWTFPPPKCFTSCYVPAIKDGEMGQFSTRNTTYGSQEEFLKLPEGERVQHNQSVYLSCKDGFMPVDYSATSKNIRLEQVTCSDGIWSKLLECQSTSCLGEPPETANAKAMFSSRAHGKSVWYQCDEGYLKEKTGDMKCDFGTWVGYTPVCSDEDCSYLLYTSQQPQLNSGYSFTIVCENGYRKKPYRKKKIRCFKGNWDIDQNPCIVASCYVPAIKDGEMGQFSTRDTMYGSQEEFLKLPEGESVQHNYSVYLSCKDDFMPVDYSSTSKNISLEQVTCSDGIWSKRLECKSTSCLGEPPKTANGHVIINSRAHGNTVWYQCDTSYVKTMMGNVVCDLGTWKGNPPECKDSRCDINKLNYAGLRRPQMQRLNDRDSFIIVCENGYRKKPYRKKKIRCFKGNWDIDQNPCIVDYVICDEFPSSPSLEVKYSNDVRVGSIASFHCSSPTTLVGNSESTCINDGTWSHPSPRCEDPKCSIYDLSSSVPIEVVPDVRDVTEEFVALGSEVRLVCENNLILIGNSKAKCVNNGNWEYRSLQCVPGCLLKKDESSHLIVLPMKEMYRFGEFIVLTCPPGRKLTSEVEKMMCLGNTWSDLIPDCA